jgi:hypothetical protein
MGGPATAQSIGAADLSGTWTLQADIDATRNRRPINGLSIATELTIRQSPSAITVESNTGTAGAIVTTTYDLDGGSHEIPGPIGWDTRATSAWDGTALTVNVRRSVQGPDGELVFEIRERYAASAGALSLERTQGRTTQRLLYDRKP